MSGDDGSALLHSTRARLLKMESRFPESGIHSQKEFREGPFSTRRGVGVRSGPLLGRGWAVALRIDVTVVTLGGTVDLDQTTLMIQKSEI